MKKLVSCLLIITFFSSCATMNRVKSNKILARADLASSSFHSEVPFEYNSNLPIFEVLIEGETYRFIFDTGGYTVLSEEIIQKLNSLKKAGYIDVKDGNSIVKRIDTYVLDELTIGGVLFSKVGFAKIDFTESEWFKCLGLDGTIGPNILKEALWRFNTQTQRITLTDDQNKLGISKNALKVPLFTDNVYKPSLTMQIAGHNKRVGFDTGYNGFLKLTDQPERLELERYPSAVRIGNRSNAGNSVVFSDVRMVKIDSIRLNGLIFTDVIASAGSKFSSDLLGSQLFNYYKVMINLSDGEMYIEEFEKKPEMKSNIESFGFGLDFRDGKVVIDYVYELSKAYGMGLKPGEAVLSVNGEVLKYSSYCDFIQNFNDQQSDFIVIELLRNNEPHLFRIKREKIL